MANTELSELLEFLKVHQPFTTMSQGALNQYALSLSLSYVKKGTEVLNVGATNDKVYMVRSGAVGLYTSDNTLITKLAEGAFFGYLSVIKNQPVQSQARCVEDSLLLECSKQDFDEFSNEHSVFQRYFSKAAGEHIRLASQAQIVSPLSLDDVGGMLQRESVCIDATASIREAALKMTQENVSALMITQNKNIIGILTDKDFRKRVVAQAIDLTLPVSEVMTRHPFTIDAGASVATALLEMMQQNTHHLPVCENGQVKGLVTVNDIVRLQADHPIFIVGDIAKQTDLAGIIAVSKRVPSLFAQLARMDAKASDVGYMMTNITDAITKRLLALAFSKFGEAPIAYAWLALGSQARKEQTAKTDQDNALVLASEATQDHIDFFLKVAHFVNDGLDACGYVYCPGEIMASNPKWCRSIDDWKHNFKTWILKPEPKAMMHMSIFFDLRCIEGDETLISDLQSEVATHAKNQEIFLSLMYQNALNFKAPIGFFRQFVLESTGEHKDTLDLKHKGLVPIVDLARIYMLASGQSEEHTLKRLNLAANVGALSQESAENLLDAFEFISHIRIQHQGRQLRQGITPDNYVSPKNLSPLLRDQLHSAFEVVENAQKVLGQRFSGI